MSVRATGTHWCSGSTSDGTRDEGFGIRRLGGLGSQSARAVALQPDGKIVVGGVDEQTQDAAVWRLLASGLPDPDFGGGDGFATINSGGIEKILSVAVAPDGKIVAGGSSSVNGRAMVYRLTAAGEPDPTFHDDGAFGFDAKYSVYGVAVQPDGKVLATLNQSGLSGGTPHRHRLHRLRLRRWGRHRDGRRTQGRAGLLRFSRTGAWLSRAPASRQQRGSGAGALHRVGRDQTGRMARRA